MLDLAIDKIKAIGWTLVWSASLTQVGLARRWSLHIVRLAHMVIREIAAGQLTLRAMSLVYTTLLSLVPLLAVSFSVLKGFGVHDQLEPALLNVLSPLGEKALEITERIVGFVENVKVGLLGSVGVGFLLFTVISLLQKIERAFNAVWRVKHDRNIGQRFTDYLSVLLVGPLLVFSAMGLTASMVNTSIAKRLIDVQPFGWLLEGATQLLPFTLIVAAFTFAYTFLPNTKVRILSALIGGAVAGALWQLAGWAFAAFVAGSTQTTAIYSSFAILVVFMIWLYLAWLILLVGACVSFYAQHPEYLGLLEGEVRLSPRMRERVAVEAMFQIAQAHCYGLQLPTRLDLADRVDVPLEALDEVLESLCREGLLIAAGENGGIVVPGRDLARISVAEVLGIVRRADESAYLHEGRIRLHQTVGGLFSELDEASFAAGGQQDFRTLVERHPPRGAARAGTDEKSASVSLLKSDTDPGAPEDNKNMSRGE
jgi:membrane protein